MAGALLSWGAGPDRVRRCARRNRGVGANRPGPSDSVARVDPVARFTALVTEQGDDAPLDLAALLIAATAHEGLDVDARLRELDRLAEGIPLGDPDGWRRRLYGELGFSGNAVDYYDPENSFLDAVLVRRTGIPITLAVVAMSVARRTGVELVGIGMPGHFLVRRADDEDAFVDPFEGIELDADGARRLFVRVASGAATTPWSPSFLEPVGTRSILGRILLNLKAVYTRRHDVQSLAWVLRLRLALSDTPEQERIELSRALAAGGRPGEAADELLTVAGRVPDRAEELALEAVRLRARLN